MLFLYHVTKLFFHTPVSGNNYFILERDMAAKWTQAWMHDAVGLSSLHPLLTIASFAC
jgi:hypothetical protein